MEKKSLIKRNLGILQKIKKMILLMSLNYKKYENAEIAIQNDDDIINKLIGIREENIKLYETSVDLYESKFLNQELSVKKESPNKIKNKTAKIAKKIAIKPKSKGKRSK